MCTQIDQFGGHKNRVETQVFARYLINT